MRLKDKTGYIDNDDSIAKYWGREYKNDAEPFQKKDNIKVATKEASERIVRFVFGE